MWTTTGDGEFNDPTLLHPTYTPGTEDVQIGMLTLRLEVIAFAGCENAVSEMIIMINESPSADAGDDQYIEHATITQLYGDAMGGSGSYLYHWSPEGLLLNPNAQNPVTVGITQNTIFVLTVTDAQTGCQDTDTVEIYTGDENLPPIAIDDYDTTRINYPVIVEVLENDYDQDGEIVSVTLCSTPENGVAQVNNDGTITYSPYLGFAGDDSFCYVICDDGTPTLCDTAMVYIHIKEVNVGEDIVIYNGFTPNGDGTNDKWIIENLENYPDNEVLIFNRWGDKLLYMEDYDNTTVYWDGNNDQGKPLPDGTYYYVINIFYEGEVYNFAGWVYMQKGLQQ